MNALGGFTGEGAIEESPLGEPCPTTWPSDSERLTRESMRARSDAWACSAIRVLVASSLARACSLRLSLCGLPPTRGSECHRGLARVSKSGTSSGKYLRTRGFALATQAVTSPQLLKGEAIAAS